MLDWISVRVSSKLFHARTKHGLTQQKVAESVSVSERWYQRLEKGENLPSALVMLRLILLLDIDIEDLREEVGLTVPLS